MKAEELVDTFFQAHSTADAGRRRQLLVASVESGAEFDGLQARLAGIEALVEGFVGDHELVRTSSVDVRGHWLRWEWEYRSPSGEPATSPDGTRYGGVAVAKLGRHGLLDVVVPFLGDRPG